MAVSCLLKKREFNIQQRGSNSDSLGSHFPKDEISLILALAAQMNLVISTLQ